MQNNLLPSGETTANGKSVVIQDVSRHHSGIYVCTADNQVGSPASAEIDLKVLCKFSHFKKITRWLDCFDSSKELFLNSLSALLISDPPEIEVDQSWIPNEEGIEAEVSCNIYAEPPADVSVY